ncbi:hypothetical protein LTR17_012328 [Elasticomyces elasticus]|nr:hypothetical protein LTR17_012328 [Elasticomyces elasticus]
MVDPTARLDFDDAAVPNPAQSAEPLFDPAALPTFDPNALRTAAGELDMFDFSETVEDFDWSMPAMRSRLLTKALVNQDTHFWFDGNDLLSQFSLPSVSPTAVQREMSPPALSLSNKMRNWFDGSSRPSSPSRNRARKMWYSALPNLTNYKQEVKEVFLRLFQKHIPATFTIFERSNCQHKRPASYILIMAAVGGLFCSVPGSAEVARSMYNDARRLSLATYNARRPEYGAGTTAEDKFVIVKTVRIKPPSYIDLELMRSLRIVPADRGDKRSYEFVEACYADLTGVSRSGANRDV